MKPIFGSSAYEEIVILQKRIKKEKSKEIKKLLERKLALREKQARAEEEEDFNNYLQLK